LVQALGTGVLDLVERAEAPVLDLAAGWDAIYASRTSSKDRRIRRRRLRRLSELGTVEWRVARTREEAAAALGDAFALHALRRRGLPDDSELADAAGRSFQREAVAALADLGVARIVTLAVDGRPVAFHSSLALEGRLYAHGFAFDPAIAPLGP